MRLVRKLIVLSLCAAWLTLAPTRSLAKDGACTARYGGDGPTSADAMEDCSSLTGNCDNWCYADYGTESDGNFYGCGTATYNATYNWWTSSGSCGCVCLPE